MFIETPDSTRLAVDVWGTGRPVVLVHAWGLDSHMWNAQLPAFLDAGLQVITFDHRGHGRSDRPAGGYDLDTMAADVIAVLDALDLHDVTLVGQSMGGTDRRPRGRRARHVARPRRRAVGADHAVPDRWR